MKLTLIDRFDTPLRRANLVDGHLRDVDVPAEITFGDEFVLLGHDPLPESVLSGDRFEVKTYWRALQPGGPDYGLTVNVVDAEGYRWSGADIRPPRWHRTPPPAREWPPDQYAILALSVPLLPGTPPGDYTIEIVAFDQDTLSPLTAHDAGGPALGPSLVLGRIAVTAPRSANSDELGIRNQLDVSLGPLTLLGADFDRDQAAPGDPVLLTTFWRAEEQPAEDLSFRLTLQTVGGPAVAEYDLPPTVSWHPTSAWEAGDVWRGQHLIHLPAVLDTGDYAWALALVPSPDPLVSLSSISIAAPDRTFTPPTPQHPVDVTLGDVATLLGFDLEPETVRPGDTVTVTLFWRAEAESHTSYNVFLHLIGSDGALVAQSDGVPANWARPTTGWLPGEFITDMRTLAIPPTVPLGDYTLSTGLYVPGGERLISSDGADVIKLVGVTIVGEK